MVDSEHHSTKWPAPHIVFEGLGSSNVEAEPLRNRWWRFFPDVAEEDAETFEYPTPFTDEFAKAYAEPVGEFKAASRILQGALSNIQHHKPVDALEPGDAETVREGFDLLNSLVSFVHPAVLPVNDGTYQLQWLTHSLFASLAMMALQDLTEHRHLLRCEVCRRLFASSAYQARYCSERCRNTHHVRGFRSRNPKK